MLIARPVRRRTAHLVNLDITSFLLTELITPFPAAAHTTLLTYRFPCGPVFRDLNTEFSGEIIARNKRIKIDPENRFALPQVQLPPFLSIRITGQPDVLPIHTTINTIHRIAGKITPVVNT